MTDIQVFDHIILISMDLFWFYFGEDFLNLSSNYLKFYPTNLKAKNSYSSFNTTVSTFLKVISIYFLKILFLILSLFPLSSPHILLIHSSVSVFQKRSYPQMLGDYSDTEKTGPLWMVQCMVTDSLTALPELIWEVIPHFTLRIF